MLITSHSLAYLYLFLQLIKKLSKPSGACIVKFYDLPIDYTSVQIRLANIASTIDKETIKFVHDLLSHAYIVFLLM